MEMDWKYFCVNDDAVTASAGAYALSLHQFERQFALKRTRQLQCICYSVTITSVSDTFRYFFWKVFNVNLHEKWSALEGYTMQFIT